VIRILRPEEAPGVLAERERELVPRMLADYRADPRSYHDGSKRFSFDSAVYGHPAVRERLRAAQQSKCCYCELPIVSEAGDVEHFRPKASVRQGPEHPRQTPGYFWLSYSWRNLLYACSKCNREGKLDFFPLEDPAARASAMHEDGSTMGEAPLLVDPSAEDPEVCIDFNEERAVAREDARRGRVTIDQLKLNRPWLLEARRERLEEVRTWFTCLRLVRAGHIQMAGPEARQYLRDICRDVLGAAQARAKFAGMIRCVVRRWLAPELDFPCTEEELVTWALSQASGPAP
jgi:uncharacterized protein (TIGR02646 family)